MAKIKSKLEKFRTRWMRWLGQMTRCDRDSWVTLLDCNWSGWPTKVLNRAGIDYSTITSTSGRSTVHYVFEAAIAEATMDELRALDVIYCQEVLIPGMEAEDI